MTTALRAGNYRTRAEFGALLEAAGLPGSGGALAYLVMRAELDGIVASGPMRGKQHTYALVAERALQQTQLHGDEALAELTRRYFASHGPATVKDFAWWSSLTTVRIRHGIALLGDELTSIDVDGLRYWYASSSIVDGDGLPAQVLQAYDEYVIGYKDSRAVANIAGLPYTFGEDRTSVHGFILDGQMIAMWRRFVAKEVISAQVKPLRPLTAAERRHIDAAFARYARFAGATVDVHIAH
jgi:hypothetical protein